METFFIILFFVILPLALIFYIVLSIKRAIDRHRYKKLTSNILKSMGLKNWPFSMADVLVPLKSAKSVKEYDEIKFFKEDRSRLDKATAVIAQKQEFADKLRFFLQDNEFKEKHAYPKVEQDVQKRINELGTYVIFVQYISPSGKSSSHRTLKVSKKRIEDLIADPSPIMSKSEYNQLIKEQNKELLDKKHHDFYEKVNTVIDQANKYRERLIINGDKDELDKLISSLFDRTVNSIKKIKDVNSEEWDVIGGFIATIEQDVNKITQRNQQIIDYYESKDFAKIKSTCDSLMDSQREFNKYINEKAQSISELFGTRVIRNETVAEDEYNYIRPYKKSITPFTAEVSAQVFASAENNPMDYVVKYFYPNKDQYPEQIQKLQLLVEELETLKDAKQIIENYKKDYQQYITNVPAFIMENDEDGFYSRLGFANISKSVLTVEYKFSYTSNGGMAQRSFGVPMTEETVIELINILQSKLSVNAFAKEQRALMTSKLRLQIKERDNYTCKMCGNSTFSEPNLLLEIDHILPVAKGGCTTEDNLQTLCWKCNRSKSDKIL